MKAVPFPREAPLSCRRRAEFGRFRRPRLSRRSTLTHVPQGLPRPREGLKAVPEGPLVVKVATFPQVRGHFWPFARTDLRRAVPAQQASPVRVIPRARWSRRHRSSRTPVSQPPPFHCLNTDMSAASIVTGRPSTCRVAGLSDGTCPLLRGTLQVSAQRPVRVTARTRRSPVRLGAPCRWRWSCCPMRCTRADRDRSPTSWRHRR